MGSIILTDLFCISFPSVLSEEDTLVHIISIASVRVLDFPLEKWGNGINSGRASYTR